MRSTAECRQRGVTLIELLVVVAIIGILAAIAYPNYVAYVLRANRTDAQQVLLQAAQRAERHFTVNGGAGYRGFRIDSTSNADLRQSPASGSAIYTVGVQQLTPSALTLRATPVANRVNRNDGFLEITSTGVKRWDRDNSGTITAGGAEESWNNR